MLKEIQQLTLDTCLLQRSCKTVKQKDSATRFLSLRLTADGAPIDLSQAETFLYCKKPDGTVVFSPTEITNAAEGQIQAELNSEMLAVPGEICAEIRIYAPEGRLLSTLPFFLMVIEAVCDDNAVESSNEFSALTEAINKVGDFAAIAGNASAAAVAAQAAANSAFQAANLANQAANGFVPDGSVTSETLPAARANLFNKNAAIEADIQTDGSALPSAGYLCTDFVPVRPGSVYTFPAGRRRHIAYYDAQKKFLRYLDGGTSSLYVAPLKIPTDIPIAWLRISYFLEDTPLTPDSFMICVGGEYYGEYIPYGGTYVDWLYTSIPDGCVTAGKIDNNAVTAEKIKNGAISPDKMGGAMYNLLDLTKLESGYLSAENGAVIDDGVNSFVTNRIAVEPGKTYSLTPTLPSLTCFYSADRAFISKTTETTVTAPAGAAYMRSAVRDTDWTRLNWQCIAGSVHPDFYVPFGKPYIPWLDSNPLAGKQLLILGDSITEYRKCHLNGVAYQNNMVFERSIHNQSVSGSPLARNSGASADGINIPECFISRFESLIGPGGAWENLTPDYFVLGGGVNDCMWKLPIGEAAPENDFDGRLNEYTACGAFEKILRLARKKWNRCFIGWYTSYDFPRLGWNESRYYNELKKVCRKYAVPVLDLRGIGNFTQSISEQGAPNMRDDMHINTFQNIRYIPLFEDFLKNRGAGHSAVVEQGQSGIINTAAGSAIKLTDSTEGRISNLKIFGRSTQNGTPSPDNPLEINCAGDKGNIKIRSNKKSVIKPIGFSAKFVYPENTAMSLTNLHGTVLNTTEAADEVIVSQNLIEDESEPSSHLNGYVSVVFEAESIPAGDYIFSCNCSISKNPLNFKDFLAIGFDNSTKKCIVEKGKLSAKFSVTASTNIIKKDIAIRIGGASMTLSNFQLADEKTPNETLPLAEPLRSLPNGTRDMYENGVIKRRVGVLSISGSENESWATEGIGEGYPTIFYMKLDGVNFVPYSSYMCRDYAAKYTYQEMLDNNNCFAMSSRPAIFFHDERFTTLAEFKARLQAEPLTVLYELAEEIIESSEPIELPTYYPETYITSDENADMEVEYSADTKKYIDSRIKQALGAAAVL